MSDSVTINEANGANPSLEEENQAQEAAQQSQGDQSLPSETDGESGDRPEWLPEKFKSPEDLAKAYSELESKLGAGDTGDIDDDDAAAAEAAVDSAGLDWGDLQAEYAENGELSQEAYDKLAEAGIPPELVDGYIEGLEARTQAIRSEVLDSVGGEEAYTEMTEWAAENLDEEAIDAFNETLESGNVQQIKLALAGLRAQFEASGAVEPSRQLSGKPGQQANSVYESVAELTKDMGDPRYSEDPAFRARVQEKLGRSSIL